MDIILNGLKKIGVALGVLPVPPSVEEVASTERKAKFAEFADIEQDIKEEAAEDEQALVEAANDDDLWDLVDKHLDAGKKVNAIKCYREITGEGLKEAKGAIEQYIDERGAA